MPGPIGALFIGIGLIVEGGYAANQSYSKRQKGKQPVPLVIEQVSAPLRQLESLPHFAADDREYNHEKQQLPSSKSSQITYQAATNEDLPPPAYEDAIASCSSSTTEDYPHIDTPPPTHPAYTSASSSSLSLQNINLPRPLDLPVIIPQRRPNSKARGWALAYSPELAKVDLSQTEFLQFLNNFNKASQTNAIYDVVNLAAHGAAITASCFAPGSGLAISMTVPKMVEAAKAAQMQRQTTTYLDTANRHIFQPRRLMAMVVSYQPRCSSDVISRDIASSPSSGKDSQSPSSQQPTATLLTTAAPLIFLNSEGQSSNFFSSYFDRRAHAIHATASSTPYELSPPSEKFRTPWTDPNSDAWKGGPLNLITGGLLYNTTSAGAARPSREDGRLGKEERKLERKVERSERKIERESERIERKGDRKGERWVEKRERQIGREERKVEQEEGKFERREVRRNGGAGGQATLEKDLLYLVIVNADGH